MPSAQVTITQLPAAGPITGTEAVPIVQNGQTVQTTTAAIAASPAQNQTFLTLNQQPTLPNSRALSGSAGVGLIDGGALSTLQIVLNGVSGALESLATGIVVKSGGTLVNRSIATTSNGIDVTNANGAAGNPTLNLVGVVGSLNSLSGSGIMAVVGGSSTTSVAITGTAGQISVANGTGPGNPTISIVPNPVLPGTGAVTLPSGTSAERPGGSPGEIRYNSQTNEYEVYQNGWVDIATSAGILDVFQNGTLIGTQDGLNFVSGGGIIYSITNDPINNRVNVTQSLPVQPLLPGNYGSSSQTLQVDVDAFGRLTSITALSIQIDTTQVTGLGTMALQDANNVLIDGGLIDDVQIGSITPNTIVGTTIDATVQFNGSGAGLTNIPNAALDNDSVTFNGVTVALGGSGTISSVDNLNGGAAGSIPYQTGANTTTFLAAGSGVLVGGTTPSYSTDPTLTGTNFSSIPNAALQNSSITIGTTGVSLGSTASVLAGLTSVTVTQSPTTALQLATKQYVDDQVSSGITIHAPVRVESPTALNATYTPGGTAVTVTDITGSKTLTFSTSPSLSLNDQIVFSSTANGLVAGTAYYVYSTPAANQVTLSLSYDGPELTTLTDGTSLTIGGLVNAGVGATLTNAGTNAPIQIDGVNLSVTNRVLVYNQTNAYENGVYTVTTVGTSDPGGTPWVLTRATDEDKYMPDSTSGMGQGDYFFVQEGDTGEGESYVLTSPNPIIIGTTNLTYTQFSASKSYSAGTGLTLSGTQFSLTSPVVTTLGGTGLTSYTTGDIVYYAAGTALSKLAIGSSTYVMTSSGTAPQWSDPATLTVGTATTATNANNVAVAAASTNATFYPAFVDATTGNQAVEVDSDLTYNPSTNTLTAGTMVATTGIFGGTF